MSMHLVGPYLTTTNYKKKNKPKSEKEVEAAAKHDAWLQKMGVKTDKPTKEKKSIHSIPDYNTGPRVTSDKVAGSAPRRTENVYTGTLIKGISQTHKSNLVPVTSKEEILEITKMRRS